MEGNDYEVVSDKDREKDESECLKALLANSHRNHQQCNTESSEEVRWEQLDESLRTLKEEIIEDCEEKITIEWNEIFDENYSETRGTVEHTEIKEENEIKLEETEKHQASSEQIATEFSSTNIIDHDNSSYIQVQKIRPKEKSHACTLCPKTFVFKYRLKRHMAVHSSDKNVQCRYCFKKFARRVNMLEHTLLHKWSTKKRNMGRPLDNHDVVQNGQYGAVVITFFIYLLPNRDCD